MAAGVPVWTVDGFASPASIRRNRRKLTVAGEAG